MTVSGSSGERYNINKKVRYAGNGYTDYPITGSNSYIVRIFGRNRCSTVAESRVKEAVCNQSSFLAEYPLDVIYKKGRFAGFLYMGTIAAAEQQDHSEENSVGQQSSRYDIKGTAYDIGLQAAVAVVCILVGVFGIYALFSRGLSREWADYSDLVVKLAYLNYYGIPAVLAGIITQTFTYRKWNNQFSGIVVSVVLGLIANLAGQAVYSIIILSLIYILYGVIAFVLRYLAALVFILFVAVWLKNKVKKR